MPRESSSVWVFPTMSAPASTSRCTTGAVRAAGACSRNQSGLPAPVTCPSMSNKSLAAKVSPASGPAGAPFNRAVEWEQNAFRGSFTDNRFHRRLIGREAGKLAQRDRLHRRTQAIIADLRGTHAARLRQQFGHRQSAKPSLARSHAATQKRFHLIGTGTAECDRIGNLLCSDVLAAADQGLSHRLPKLRRW